MAGSMAWTARCRLAAAPLRHGVGPAHEAGIAHLGQDRGRGDAHAQVHGRLPHQPLQVGRRVQVGAQPECHDGRLAPALLAAPAPPAAAGSRSAAPDAPRPRIPGSTGGAACERPCAGRSADRWLAGRRTGQPACCAARMLPPARRPARRLRSPGRPAPACASPAAPARARPARAAPTMSAPRVAGF